MYPAPFGALSRLEYYPYRMSQISSLFIRKVVNEVDTSVDKRAFDHQPTTLPLRAGAAMRCDDYGAFGLAWKSATNLRGSYERAERHARVLTSVSTTK